MRGRVKRERLPEEPTFNSQAWPYLFTVVITSTDQEKARQVAENYHEYVHDAWNHRDPTAMVDVILDTTPVELM